MGRGDELMPMFRGRRCCSCDAEWLPVYEKLMILRGRIKKNIDIYQLIGNASKSAGYHCCGGNHDLRQADEEDIRIARNGGAAASRRDGRDGMIVHNHQVLVGCPHASRGSKAQILEINNGGDGLVGGKRDRGPRDGVHWPLRHYKDGIKWMKAEIAKLEGTPEEDDMPEPKELWQWDGIEPPNPTKENPTWTPQSVLTVLLRNSEDQQKRIAAMERQIASIAKAVDTPADSPDPTPAPTPEPTPTTPTTPKPRTYKVVPGDTLGEIATRFGLDLNDLVKWNQIANPNQISPGQTLKLTP